MLWLYLLIVTVANSEVLTFTNSNIPSSDIIQCQDAYSPCVINCNSSYVCSNHELHCHSTSPLACTINLNANYTAPSATVYAHLSSIITLTCSYQYCGQNIAVHAYERLGTQLSIDVTGLNALTSGWIYGPLGHNSFLSMRCGDQACKYMRIFDDWTTTVRLESVSGKESFSRTVIRNIFDADYGTGLFDADVLGISRSDYGTGPAMKYRGFVYIIECFDGMNSFANLRYFGVNHGGWYIRVQGSYSLMYAYLYMITDNRVDQSVQYPVKMYGKGGSNLRRATRFEFGVGAGGFIEAIGEKTLFYSNIYARNAHSLTIWCRGNTVCSRLVIEAPQTDSPNSFNWLCDDTATCTNEVHNSVEISNGYACSNYYMSSRIDARVYCGYDQTAQQCDLYLNHNYDCDASCGTACTFDNPITPVSIATQMDAFCDTLEPTTSPSDDPTTASPSTYPTKSPSNDPTAAPSNYPTASSNGPTVSPSSHPTDLPTASPSKGPSKSPSKYPTKSPSTDPTRSTMTTSGNPTVVPTTRKEKEVVEPHESSISPTTSIKNAPYEGSDIWLMVLICVVISLVCAVVVAIVCISKYHLKQKKQMKEAVVNCTIDVGLYNNDAQTSMFDDENDKENDDVIGVVNKMTAGGDMDGDDDVTGLDLEMTAGRGMNEDAGKIPSQGEMYHHYMNDTQPIAMEFPQKGDQQPRIKYVSDSFDNDKDDVIEVDRQMTVGKDVDVVMEDDEFEVIGDDEIHNEHVMEGQCTTVGQ
eukprot:700983_1